MPSKHTEKSKGVMPSSTDAAEGAVSDKPAQDAVVVGLAGKAPPASQSSSQPRSRKKSTKKGRRKRRPSQKPIKTRTVPSAEKGPAAMSTLQPSTGSPPTHPAATSGVTTAQTALGQQSSMYPTSLALPDSTAVPTHSPKGVSNYPEKASTEAKVFAIMLLAGAVVAFTILLLPSPVPKRSRLCITQSCAEHRGLIESQLDESLDPCQDFAAHVCGRWAPRKEFVELSRSALTDMVMAWKSKVPDTLLKGVAWLPAGRKAAAMFNSCMTQTGSQVDVIKNFMSTHGLVWPEDSVGNSPDPVEVLFDLAFNWNANLWFTLDLLPSAADNQQKRRLFIAPNDLTLEWRSIFRQIPRKFFDKFYRTMFRLFASGTDTSPLPHRIGESYNRLKYVFDEIISSSTGKARVPAVLPLRELDDLTDLTNSTYIKRTIDTKLGIQPPFTMEDLILLSDVALLHAILNIFGEIDDSVVRRHLAWLFLEACAAVASPATVLLILYGSKRRAEAVRPLFCAGQVEASYKLLVSAMVAVMQFSEEERRSVDTHLASILEVGANAYCV
ncbi:hypothetical protein V5799_013369 [Amblyomma americanum]|uniref:Peptidase M13 N-terminal domain-containing protein n=1 Tax=Amblyomma americanum TaxID=6943 RepID=A0AAQ4E647_AMBAM